MSQLTNSEETISDRIQLPFKFEVDQMKKDIEALQLGSFVYYDSLPLRAPSHLVDTTLPFPPPADDYADGTWTEWMNADALIASPYLTSVVKFFQENCTVNLVRLLRLAPGAVVKEHTDPTLGLHIVKSMIRLTIPIIADDNVAFYLNNTPVPMKPGECWYLNLTNPHKVINDSPLERINLTIDVIPNDWIKSIILESQDC